MLRRVFGFTAKCGRCVRRGATQKWSVCGGVGGRVPQISRDFADFCGKPRPLQSCCVRPVSSPGWRTHGEGGHRAGDKGLTQQHHGAPGQGEVKDQSLHLSGFSQTHTVKSGAVQLPPWCCRCDGNKGIRAGLSSTSEGAWGGEIRAGCGETPPQLRSENDSVEFAWERDSVRCCWWKGTL